VTTQDLNIPDPPAGADPQTAAGSTSGRTTSSVAQNAYLTPVLAPSFGAAGPMVASPTGMTAAHGSTDVQPRTGFPGGRGHSLAFQGIDRNDETGIPARGPRAHVVLDSALAELGSEPVSSRGGLIPDRVNPRTMTVAGIPSSRTEQRATPHPGAVLVPVAVNRVRLQESPPWLNEPKADLASIVLAAGFCAYAASALGDSNRQERTAGRNRLPFKLVTQRG
jgi:hypothetical protein